MNNVQFSNMQKTSAHKEISNISNVPLNMETKKEYIVTIPAEASTIILFNREDFRGLTAKNLVTGLESNLKINLF